MSTQFVIDAIRASGPFGLTGDDIGRIVLGRARKGKINNNRVHRAIEHARIALRMTQEEILSVMPGSPKTAYYIKGASENGVAASITTTSIPSISRRVSGDLGLGATPGAMVSVARVTWLDGHA